MQVRLKFASMTPCNIKYCPSRICLRGNTAYLRRVRGFVFVYLVHILISRVCFGLEGKFISKYNTKNKKYRSNSILERHRLSAVDQVLCSKKFYRAEVYREPIAFANVYSKEKRKGNPESLLHKEKIGYVGAKIRNAFFVGHVCFFSPKPLKHRLKQAIACKISFLIARSTRKLGLTWRSANCERRLMY